MNAVELEIARHLFESIAEEMGTVLMRAAFSSNIRERLDHSCALFDANAEMVAQAAHIPVHLGATPMSVRAAIDAVEMKPGQDVILNNPYAGGTHLPDITLIRPIYHRGVLTMYACNRAHHADVGGKTPGSMGLCTTLADEGFVIDPQPLTDAIIEQLSAASWTPHERRGDLRAQRAANLRAEKRVIELLEKRPDLVIGISAVQSHGEKLMRSVISELTDGESTSTATLDDDGVGTEGIVIRCTVSIRGDHATVDFSGSDPQCAGPLNVPEAVTCSAVYYAFRCLAPDSLPTNGGYMRCVDVVTEPGTIVNAKEPSPVALGNVETSQRIVDAVFRALAIFAPDVVPADSYGSMNNVIFSGTFQGHRFSYYETIAGGSGATKNQAGESAIQCHMTNTLNTPVESLECEFPVRILNYSIREGTGGRGASRGGDGIRRTYQFLTNSRVCVLAERHLSQPRGLSGGGAAESGGAFLNDERLGSKSCFEVKAGDVLTVETAGGAGWGEPTSRVDQ